MYLVFDFETVPDLALIKAALAPFEGTEEELLAKAEEELARNKSGFLPPMYHRLVAWVGLWIDPMGNPKKEIRWSGENEKEGLQSFIEHLGVYKDFKLIHHNGRGFDLPVLMYRSMRHRLQLPRRLGDHAMRYRFSNENIDLVDEFSNYGASSWPKLKHLGLIIDIPFKQTAEGNMVMSMFQEGKIKEIEWYCLEDVLATYLIWLHYQYTVGNLEEIHFENLRSRATAKLIEVQQQTEEE